MSPTASTKPGQLHSLHWLVPAKRTARRPIPRISTTQRHKPRTRHPLAGPRLGTGSPPSAIPDGRLEACCEAVRCRLGCKTKSAAAPIAGMFAFGLRQGELCSDATGQVGTPAGPWSRPLARVWRRWESEAPILRGKRERIGGGSGSVYGSRSTLHLGRDWTDEGKGRSVTPHKFIFKWESSTLKERSSSQEHFLDLCRILGEPTPAESGLSGDVLLRAGSAQREKPTAGTMSAMTTPPNGSCQRTFRTSAQTGGVRVGVTDGLRSRLH